MFQVSALGELLNADELLIISSARALVKQSLRKHTCEFRYGHDVIVVCTHFVYTIVYSLL